jgi:hypothetical protein
MTISKINSNSITTDESVTFTTNTGTTPVVVTRLGEIDESLQISVEDDSVIFKSEQDEVGRYGGYKFISRNAGTDIDRMIIDLDGAVGIGTSSVTSGTLLDVRGNVRIGDGTTNEQDISYYGLTGSWQVGVNHQGQGTNGDNFFIWTNQGQRYGLKVNGGTGSPSGTVNMPYQPAFTAYKSATSTTSAVNTIVYDATYLNNGNHYSTSTGQFTAPIDGMYQFTSVSLSTGGSVIQTQLYVNGVGKLYAENTRSNLYGQCITSGVFNLSAGDTVRVVVTSGSDYGNKYSYFSGHLIG